MFHSWSVVSPADVHVRFTPTAVDSNLSQGTEWLEVGKVRTSRDFKGLT